MRGIVKGRWRLGTMAVLVGRLFIGMLTPSEFAQQRCSNNAKGGVVTTLTPSEFAQQSIQTIYVAPMSHLDIGFTAPPSQVALQMRRTADQAVAFANDDPTFVWTFETFWQLERWWESNTKEPAQRKLLRLVREGRFEVGAAYVNPHSAAMSAFLLDWLFRLPKEWANVNGVPMRTAILNDVPGHPIDLPHFLSRNSIRYLVVGANLQFSPPLPDKIASTPFWWEAPMGERVLTWIADRSYTEAFSHMGFDPDCARLFNTKKFHASDPMKVMEQGIWETLKRYQERGYPYDAILVLHAFDNWDAFPSSKLPRYAKLWNERHASPKVQLCTPQAFFEHIEGKYEHALPVYRGGFGGQWESFVRPAIPTAMRVARQAEHIIQSTPRLDQNLVRNLLIFYEHSFGMGAGWPNTMTREEMVQHNREQFALLMSLPKQEKNRSAPSPTHHPQPLLSRGEMRSNCLYWLKESPLFMAPNKDDLQPLNPEAWVRSEVEGLEGGRLRFRHWIDRRKLPTDPIHIVWLWQLNREQAKAKIQNRTATGWETLPDDRLANYDWGGWFSPFGFRLGGWEFRGEGVFAFCRQVIDAHHWLIGVCLGQGLSTVFKGGQKGALAFEEAYPGEDAVVEICVEVHPSENH